MCNKWNELHTMKNYRHDHRGFNFERAEGIHRHRGMGFHFPPVTVSEEEDHYAIRLGVPGYNKTDFKITLSGDNLIVAVDGKIKGDWPTSEHIDFGTRPFKKRFILNEKMDTEKIIPSYENGVLTIRIDKKEIFHTPVREIDIA